MSAHATQMPCPPLEPNTLPSGNHQLSRGRWIWEILSNVVLSILFLRFALAHGGSYLQTLRISTLLLFVKVTIDATFYLARRTPRGVSTSPYDWIIALAGTYTLVLFRPVAGGHDLLIGQLLQWTGLLMQICSMLSLNRSVGIVPANRGVKTGGFYRFVRHPLYLSYIVACGGYLVNQFCAFNAWLYLAAISLWVLRLYAEERLLMKSDDYRAYAKRQPYRLVPFVF